MNRCDDTPNHHLAGDPVLGADSLEEKIGWKRAYDDHEVHDRLAVGDDSLVDVDVFEHSRSQGRITALLLGGTASASTGFLHISLVDLLREEA